MIYIRLVLRFDFQARTSLNKHVPFPYLTLVIILYRSRRQAEIKKEDIIVESAKKVADFF